MTPSSARAPIWIAVWAVLVAAMLLVRPAVPIDETRYLASAWEMWWRGSVAVPYLNGDYYDGKPPLLFWLMHLGWLVWGVDDWWPRLIAPLSGLACLALVRGIARRLWPSTSASDLAPLVLLGSALWALFCASTMFDTLLGAFAVGAVYFIVRAAQERRTLYFAGAGFCLGLGILAKGPVVFLPSLWIVLFAPWWMDEAARARWPLSRWYAHGLFAAAIAGAIAALWLVPMALSSNAAYVDNMLFHQTAGYVTESFSHRRPVWWYLPLVPLVLFPWTLWPAAWRSLAAIRRMPRDAGVRLCLVWAIGVFLTFSLISGKQAHYLLLAFPGAALLLARMLPETSRATDRSIALPALFIGICGVALLAFVLQRWDLPSAAWTHEPPAAIVYAGPAALLAVAAFIVSMRRASVTARVRALAAGTCAAILALTWATMTLSAGAYDLRPASAYLSRVAAAGGPLAIASRYDGQFNFYGRIKAHFEEIEAARAVDWAREHPTGHVVVFYKASEWPPRGARKPAYAALYRGGGVVVWAAQDLVADPDLAQAFR